MKSPSVLLALYLVLSLLREGAETALAALNRRYYRDPARQREAMRLLGLRDDDMTAALAYAEDRYRFARVNDWTRLLAGLVFLAAGGLGWIEGWARAVATRFGGSTLLTGLLFFAILGIASEILGLPFEYYAAFHLEARHGFNRQTLRGFVIDRLKSWVLGAALGGALLAIVLTLLASGGRFWWLYAWAAVTLFSLLTVWLYPRLLAPLFNRFTPLPDGPLRTSIHTLAERVGFHAGGIYVMDASRRTAHGNAYFTGLFREKRIVLFDTLLSSLSDSQVVAVLAHELGHFKLHHVRAQLLRGLAFTGLTFYLLSRCVGLTPLYRAFRLDGLSPYGALVVFAAWFGLIDFALQPLANALSRRHELAADAFARTYETVPQELARALLRLREESRGLPLYHPAFSWAYHSHPPLIERLQAMGYRGEPAGAENGAGN